MKESAIWKDLEAKIGRAIEEIEALRKQNRKLSSRVKRLQREGAEKPAASAAWEAEKESLRERVEGLVKTLESLL